MYIVFGWAKIYMYVLIIPLCAFTPTAWKQGSYVWSLPQDTRLKTGSICITCRRGIYEINQSKCLFRIVQRSLCHVQCSSKFLLLCDDYAHLTLEKSDSGWMDVRVLRPFNSISVISRRWKGELERLCAMKRRLGSGRISPPAGFEPATPWSEVGSANRSATRTLQKSDKTSLPLGVNRHCKCLSFCHVQCSNEYIELRGVFIK